MDKETRALLNRILSDPHFRSELQKDPVKALGSVGITADPSKLPKPITLPSDDEIRALLVLEKNLDHLKLCFISHQVCSWPKP